MFMITLSEMTEVKSFLKYGFNTLKPINISLLTVLIFFTYSCKEEIVDQIDVEPTTLWVSIINETSSPLSLSFQVGIGDSLQRQRLIYKPFDTLKIELTRERLLTIESKFSLEKKLIVSSGDSLFIDLKKGGINIAGTSLNYIEPGKRQFQTQTALEQDSLYSLLVQVDSSQSMSVSNDYSIKELIPIFFQEDFYQEHPEVLENFANMVFAEMRTTTSTLGGDIPRRPDVVGVKEELHLNRNFLRLSFLARRSKNESLKDKLVNSSYFDQEFLLQSQHSFHYLRYYLEEVVLGGKKDRSTNKLYIDYREVYDLLDQHFEEPLLAKAKMLSLKKMIEYSEPYESIGAYATDYQNAYPEDSSFMKSFQNNFLLNQQNLVNSSVGLNLLNEEGEAKMLTGLLKELKGKVVYIDYWASWCAPCRSAMPSSIELRKSFADKDVAFVYFSIDSGQEAWRSASKSDELEGYKHNYLVLNHKKSEFRQHLKMEAIPRYLIFDKQGELVERNAPSPVSDGLEGILNKYLAK